jgi:hypothetical protein
MLIYEICCAGKKYRGKTGDWKKRKGYHKSNLYNINGSKYNRKVYKYIRENGGLSGCSFNILETDLTEEEACIKEGEYIRAIPEDIRLNIQIPGRLKNETEKIWRENNKEKIKETYHLYYQKNKEKILETSRLYYIDNKDKIKECAKKCYEKNKEKYKARQALKIVCPECKKMRSKRHMKRHYKIKHPTAVFQ